MLKHKPYTEQDAEIMYEDFFWKFSENSNYEYMFNRWTYDDDDYDIDEFFKGFSFAKQYNEFFTETRGALIRIDRVNESNFYLYKLRKEMFYWDNFGRGIIDLFTWGSVYVRGYELEGKQKAEEFKSKVLGVRANDDVVYYSDHICKITPGEDRLKDELYELEIKSQDMTGLHNLDFSNNFPPGSVWLDFVTDWFHEYGDNGINIIHNKTKKEIIFWIMADRS